MVEGAQELDRLYDLVFARLFQQPILLCTIAGHRQHGSGVRTADLGQRRDRVVDALLVFEPPHKKQHRRSAVCGWSGREDPTSDVDSVADDVDLWQLRPK
ncbi:Uncharacterised protein [Mycobacteroides abscessus subsp. abscessus]|nr:Uncharacterised protein [Mycobacteroides abscessus subsp. abscessus]